jgi:membrane fusion protein (multidrug efflux system)
MMWTQLKVWACGLAALGVLAISGGAVSSQRVQAQSPPMEPDVKQAALPPKGSKPVPPKDDREAEVEALKKEIEALRKKVEALSKKEEQPRQEHHKIVVTSPQAKDIVITQQYVGKIRSHHHINVRALEGGYLEAIPVKEGQVVKKGDALCKILPVLYQARLDAELAEVRLAELELNNVKKLLKDKAVSPNEVALYEAKLAKAKAKAKLAEAELSFSTVRAPFDGIVGRLQTQQGSLVKEGETLTTLSDNSVMWVYFNVPEARYFEYMAGQGQAREELKIELVLANSSKFPKPGKIGAIEAQFEYETGNIPFRADFPNPDRLLRHGQTGTVLIHRALKNAIVIPQRATFEIFDQRFVYVVGKDDVVDQREIFIEHEMEDIFVIKKGLDVHDRIVLDGFRRFRDGAKVEYEFRKPEEVMANPKKHGEK